VLREQRAECGAPAEAASRAILGEYLERLELRRAIPLAS
jgi:hypothetical protein